MFQTDKSGKFSIDTIENFSTKMQPHLEESILVDRESVLSIEEEFNARSICWGRILKIGEKWHHEDRVKQARMLKLCTRTSKLKTQWRL